MVSFVHEKYREKNADYHTIIVYILIFLEHPQNQFRGTMNGKYINILESEIECIESSYFNRSRWLSRFCPYTLREYFSFFY